MQSLILCDSELFGKGPERISPVTGENAMDRQFQLCGSVKPYFGRSSRPGVESSGTIVVAPSSPENVGAAGDHVLKSAPPLQVVRQAVRMRNWTVFENDTSCEVIVPIGSNREQTVSVELTHHDELGHPLLVCSSRCGPVAKRNAMALLRRNLRLFRMAFAVEKSGDVELIVVRGSQRADNASWADVAQLIEAIATYADRVEERLVGTDEF